MGKLILYHGSPEIIEKPEYGKGSPYNDYGQGFYCTEHSELAKEWACEEGIDGYANRYELDADGLSVLDLSSGDYTVLNWLALLLKNRKVRLSTPLSVHGAQYLIDNFLPDYENYDLIVGYRADDSYFAYARMFVSNQISLAQLQRAMKLGKLGEQYVLKSQKAFDSITFLGCERADSRFYWLKRTVRDVTARESFLIDAENEDLNGIYMKNILNEEMKNDDPRLQ